MVLHSVFPRQAEVAYTWDTKWKSAVKSYAVRWTTEISIPFRSLRYFEGFEIWGIKFGRLDLKTKNRLFDQWEFVLARASAWIDVAKKYPYKNAFQRPFCPVNFDTMHRH